MDDSATAWNDFFARWPDEMARQGILVTSFQEQIPFSGFLRSASLLLLERHAPDSLGARTVVLSFKEVVALKITAVVKPKTFQSVGFEGPAPKK